MKYLGGLSVTAIVCLFFRLIMLFITKMLGHLGLHRPFDQGFRELLQKPLGTGNFFLSLVILSSLSRTPLGMAILTTLSSSIAICIEINSSSQTIAFSGGR